MQRCLPGGSLVTEKARVLLVGDNRRTVNWGGRSAGLALCDLLAQEFQIADTVEGHEFWLQSAGYGFVGTLLPARYDHLFHYLHSNRSRRRVFDWYVRFEEILGARDFVTESAVDSVDNLMRYRNRIPQLEALYGKTARADLVVVNGEGDFVFTTPPRREALFMLAMIELALRLEKKVFFVNAMLSDCPQTGRNGGTVRETQRLLAKCEAVLLRDPWSVSYARAHLPAVRCNLVPDAVFAWYRRATQLLSDLPHDGDLLLPYPERQQWFRRLDFARPYLCVGGTAAAWGNRPRAVETYTRLVQQLQRTGLPVYLTANDGPDEFLEEVAERTGAGFVPLMTPIYAAFAILAGARLFVSGRYHPSILASLGGTPCVFLGSTAHKMSSLQSLLEYPTQRCFSAFPNDAEVEEICSLGQSYVAAGEDLRHSIAAVASRLSRTAETLPQLLVGEPSAERTGCANRPDTRRAARSGIPR